MFETNKLRIQKLKENLLAGSHWKYRTFTPLSVLDDENVFEKPLVVRKAMAFALMLEEMSIYIQEDELIVGGRTIYGRGNKAHSGPTFREGQEFSLGYYPRYATEEEKADVAGLASEGASLSHTAAGYDRVLEKGYGGLIRMAERKTEELKSDGGDIQSQLDFLDAVKIVCNTTGQHILRYADLAAKMAAKSESSLSSAKNQSSHELEQISDNCREIAYGTPKTFWQALQLFWFTHVFALMENYSLMAMGCFDRYMYPFYKADIDAGRITKEQAQELIECTWIKLNESADISTDNGLNAVFSGIGPDGQDVTNEISYMCLDATMNLQLVDPQINTRLHKNTPEPFMRKCCELAKLGMGYPSIFNDDSIIPSLQSIGIPFEDACEYCNDGCTEVFISGKSDFYPVFAGQNLLSIFVGTLNKLERFETFGEFIGEFKGDISDTIKNRFANADERDRALAKISPVPFLSATLHDCIESAKDKTEGGALYNHTGSIGGGLVNCVNSLAAVKKLVYEDKRVGKRELIDALAANFDEEERLRQMLIVEAPKFGNGSGEVDAIAHEVAKFYCDEVLKYENPRGGRYLPGFFQYHYVNTGKSFGATPDGRKAGDSLAVDLSPYLGTSRAGPTGVAQSVSAIDQSLCPLGTSTDIKLHPTALAGEEGTQKFAAFIKTFLAMGNMQLQMNVVDAKMLNDAQEHPEKYKDLVVRVWGFNAYFVTLAKDYQDYIIQRTAQRL